jgi:NAD(P)-dependent dehydrogenase (short-subunit alcohol dehydrogenase family)
VRWRRLRCGRACGLAESQGIVGAVLFLVSRASAMVTGDVLTIDGGFLAR